MLSSGIFLPVSKGILSARTLLLCGQCLAQDNRVFVMERERDKTLGASVPGRRSCSLEHRAVRVIFEDLWAVYLRLKCLLFFFFMGRAWCQITDSGLILRNFFGYCWPFWNYLKELWRLFYSWSCVSLPGRALQPRASECFTSCCEYTVVSLNTHTDKNSNCK